MHKSRRSAALFHRNYRYIDSIIPKGRFIYGVYARDSAAAHQRDLARQHLRIDRSGLHDDLRHHQAHQLRTRRHLHGRCLSRVLRDHARHPRPAGDPHIHGGYVAARRSRRAVRLSAAAPRAAHLGAHHGDRHVVPARICHDGHRLTDTAHLPHDDQRHLL